MHQLRMVTTAKEAAAMKEHYTQCEKCKRRLKGKVAFLELDQRNGTFHDFGDVPADKSQGWFPFGLDCANGLIFEAKQARSK